MGSRQSGVIDKSAYEKQWASHEARQKLSKEDRHLFETARHTFRPYVYFDKVLVAWTMVQGEPRIKEVFKVVGIDVSFQEGIWLTMYAEVAKRELRISHSPRPLLDLGVFAWVPFFNELRYASPDWEDPDARKNLRLHACFKTPSSPDHTVEGHTYLTELHTFRETWPQYAKTRF